MPIYNKKKFPPRCLVFPSRVCGTLARARNRECVCLKLSEKASMGVNMCENFNIGEYDNECVWACAVFNYEYIHPNITLNFSGNVRCNFNFRKFPEITPPAFWFPCNTAAIAARAHGEA